VSSLDNAPPVSPPEKTKQSDKLKRKLHVQYITSISLAPLCQPLIKIGFLLLRIDIDSLINDFSYAHFTDNKIVELLSKYDFSLGITDNIRLKMVQHFRSLIK
jgi:hypothetical protein